MRIACLISALFCAWAARAQEAVTRTNSARDLNGTAVEGPSVLERKSPGAVERTEKRQSINGRLAPAETVEERVLRDDSSGRLIERVVKRFDPAGNPLPVEKTTIEETKRASGLTVRTTTRRADLNGNMAVAERSQTDVEKTGARETSETVTERLSLNGGFEPVEKRSVVKEGSGESFQENTVVFRKGENGFVPALRVVTQHSSRSNGSTDEQARYEPGSSGQMELRSQTVSRATKQPDGSESRQVDRFGVAVAGTVSAAGSGMRLQERELVERRKTAAGLIEIVRVQRPTVSDPGVLGPARVISETECRGKCQ